MPAPGRRGAVKPSNKSKFLSQNRALGSDTTRSIPSSPALSGIGSPSQGPTSVPLSQQQAEQAKAARKPVIHLLSVQPMTEKALREKVPDTSRSHLKEALQKVGDLNESTGKWELRRIFYKELDVWTFDYTPAGDRQRAIDNAVRQYDKMRLGVSEPEWDKLLVKAERGTGKCLSKNRLEDEPFPFARLNSAELRFQQSQDGTGNAMGGLVQHVVLLAAIEYEAGGERDLRCSFE